MKRPEDLPTVDNYERPDLEKFEKPEFEKTKKQPTVPEIKAPVVIEAPVIETPPPEIKAPVVKAPPEVKPPTEEVSSNDTLVGNYLKVRSAQLIIQAVFGSKASLKPKKKVFTYVRAIFLGLKLLTI